MRRVTIRFHLKGEKSRYVEHALTFEEIEDFKNAIDKALVKRETEPIVTVVVVGHSPGIGCVVRTGPET